MSEITHLDRAADWTKGEKREDGSALQSARPTEVEDAPPYSTRETVGSKEHRRLLLDFRRRVAPMLEQNAQHLGFVLSLGADKLLP